MCEYPLVTVGIVSFNSSSFVLETLESVKNQTYKNIELIISDDGSSDDTLSLCEDWVKSNNLCFKRVKLITVEKNTGTSGNCQRVLDASNGEWIKFLAADDLLFDDAIEKYIRYIKENNNVKVICAESTHFYDKFNIDKLSYDYLPLEKLCFSKRTSAEFQYRVLQKIFIGSGPTSFFNKKALLEVGGFDLRFPLIEDHPLFLNLTRNGYKISLLNDYTVHKRIHGTSVINEKSDNSLYSNQIVRCIKEYKLLYKYEHQNFLWRLFTKFSIYLHLKVIENGNTKQSIYCRVVYKIQQIIDPYRLYDFKLIIYNKILKLWS